MLKLVFLWFAIFAVVWGDDISTQKPDMANMSDRDLIIQLVQRVNHLEMVNGIQQKRMGDMEITIDRQAVLIERFGKILGEQVKKTEADPAEETIEPTKRPGNQRDQNGKQRIRQVTDAHIAFSALAKNRMNHLGFNQNLMFEVENVDTANVFDHHNGVFIAPFSGVYFVSVSVLAAEDCEVYSEIVVNAVVKGNVYSRGTDGRHDQGSQSILLHLKKGDDVAVKNLKSDDNVYGGLYTSFSGFLLFEEEVSTIVG